MPVGDCSVRSNSGSSRQLGPDDKKARLSIVGTIGGGEAGSCNCRAALDFKLCYFFLSHNIRPFFRAVHNQVKISLQ
jgi:hypothetical protein